MSVLAEYRVYQYIITPKLQPKTPKSYTVTSTLAPTDYLTYHGGSSTLNISLIKTWSCLGHTGGRDLCDDPIAQLGNEGDTNIIRN